MNEIPLNPSVQPEDAPRLSRQARDILSLFLTQDRVSTGEMADIACQYAARLYEIRRAGYNIPLVEKGTGGNNFYQLKQSQPKGRQGTMFDCTPRKDWWE